VKAVFYKDELLGQSASFKQGQTTYAAVIVTAHESKRSTYWVSFEHESQVDRWVDLMLPKRVKDGEYSWWQLTDGYSEWVPVVSEPEEVHEDENHNEDESDSGEDTD
jgi:hypothetical protein